MRLLIILISVFTFCCSVKKNTTLQDNEEIPENVFKYISIVVVKNENLSVDYDAEKRKYSLSPLSDSQMTLLTDPFFGEQRLYNAYFYSKQNNIGEIRPILVYLDRDENSTVVLFSLSKNNEVIDHIELTGESSDFDGEDENNPVLKTYERYSEFLNDSSIRISEISSLIERYGLDTEITQMDSLAIEYRIRGNGRIEQISRDSSRNVRKMN
jgi:hypothetical protein